MGFGLVMFPGGFLFGTFSLWGPSFASLVPLPASGGKITLTEGSIDLVKGFTKASVIAFVLLSLAECDVNTEWAKIQPFCRFLDRAWLLPIHDTRLT